MVRSNGGFKNTFSEEPLGSGTINLIRAWFGVSGLALLVILEPWASRLFVWVLTLRGQTAGAAHKDHQDPPPKATPVNPTS
jgi:hypothetical protein